MNICKELFEFILVWLIVSSILIATKGLEIVTGLG